MPPPSSRSGHGAAAGRPAPRRRREHAEEAEEGGAERWLVTYADMLTLLLVLFIVLFSISVVNTSKFISLRTSLAAVFGDGTKGMLSGGTGLNENDAQGTGQQLVMPGVPVSPVQAQRSSSTNPNQPATAPAAMMTTGFTADDVKRELDQYRHIQQAIAAALDQHGLHGAARFAITGRGLVVTVVTTALIFPGNSADLLPDGQRLLAAIGPPLASDNHRIEVDGYTNQQNVSTAPYASGWELSAGRASAVVRALIGYGVAESRLSAVGYSDQHPLYPPSDPRSITLNRRVEIVALSNLPSAAGAALQAAANAGG